VEIGTALLLASTAAALAILFWRQNRRIKEGRARLFETCLPLLEAPRLTQDAAYFPTVTARYGGRDVSLALIAEHVVPRKLPVLWLLVTVKDRMPYAGTFDFLVRPHGIEFFSPSSALEHRLPLPAGWPEHAMLRSDRPEALPPQEILDRHRGFFDDEKAKELVVAPKGVRLVYQVDQAKLPHFAVFREIQFTIERLDPELVRALLDRAAALHADLMGPAHADRRRAVA
jgi:hypothetical protein